VPCFSTDVFVAIKKFGAQMITKTGVLVEVGGTTSTTSRTKRWCGSRSGHELKRCCDVRITYKKCVMKVAGKTSTLTTCKVGNYYIFRYNIILSYVYYLGDFLFIFIYIYGILLFICRCVCLPVVDGKHGPT